MDAKGFFSSLFDYSFSSFVTPRIIKILYILATIGIALWTFVILLAGFRVSSSAGVLTLLVVCPLFFLWMIIWTRVGLELIMVLFRINANVQGIHDGRSGGAAPTTGTPSAGGPAAEPVGSGAGTGLAPAAPAAAVEEVSETEPTAASSSPPEPGAAAPPKRYCENCGAERSPTSRFCTTCGQE
jgi:hypothetical protein